MSKNLSRDVRNLPIPYEFLVELEDGETHVQAELYSRSGAPRLCIPRYNASLYVSNHQSLRDVKKRVRQFYKKHASKKHNNP